MQRYGTITAYFELEEDDGEAEQKASEILYSALDLELLAAMGSSSPVPVEIEMELPSKDSKENDNGRIETKSVVLWPETFDSFPEMKELSKYWSKYAYELCQKAPMTLA